jgi:hypothetical protein
VRQRRRNKPSARGGSWRERPPRKPWPLLTAPSDATDPPAKACRAAPGWQQARLRGTRGERLVRNGAQNHWIAGPPPPKWVPSRINSERDARKLRRHGEKQWLGGWLAAAPSQDPRVLVREYGAVISPVFLREPLHQKARPCVDYVYPNGFEQTEKYTEEDMRHVPEWGEPFMHMWELDVQSAFPHVYNAREAQRYQVQDWGPPPPGPGPHRPRFAVPLVMVFGKGRSPKNWKDVRTPMEHDLRREGHRSSWFADDGLGGSADKTKAEQGCRRALELFAFYGLTPATDKGQGAPWLGMPPVSQTVTHLGLDLDTRTEQGLFSVPLVKARAVQKMARQLLGHASRHRRWVPRRWVQTYFSTLLSLILADKEARCRTRMLIECCRVSGCFVGRRGNWGGDLKVNKAAWQELKWGAQYVERVRGNCVWRPPVTHAAAVDASKDPAPRPSLLERQMDGCEPAPSIHAGWGALYFEGGAPNGGVGCSPTEQAALMAGRGSFAPPRWEHVRVAHGVFTSDEAKHMIAWLEMRALRRMVQHAPRDAAGRHIWQDAIVLVWEDNSNCVSIVQKMMSKSPELHREWLLLKAEVDAINVQLILRWVASARNPSDYWTRLLYRSDWSLARAVVEQLWALWGRPSVDRFAQPHDHVVERWNCPYPHPGSEALDCWTQTWAGELNWLNPPWAMLGRVTTRLRAEPTAAAIVIVPCFWARWYPALLDLAVDGRRLRLGPGDITPGPIARASPEPLRNAAWRLAAYYVPAGAAARAAGRPTMQSEGGLPALAEL